MTNKLPLEVLENNDHFIAINKPSGLLSIPDRIGKDPSVKTILQQHFEKIFTVHRLDKDTSGIIIFAKNEDTHKQLSLLFENRLAVKYYTGLVHGRMEHNTGTIDANMMEHPAGNGSMITHTKGKPSVTDYEVLEYFKTYSWIKFQIHTGRTHQIRVHSQHIGHAIVCDALYGSADPVLLSNLKKKYKPSKYHEEQPMLSRLGLHAWQLQFTLNDEQYNLEAPLAKDLRALLQQLRKIG